MLRRRRSPFADLVERQLALFATENAELLERIDAALVAYDEAGSENAEERFGDYLDLVGEAREALEEIRDAYASTLPAETADEYRSVFAQLAARRFPVASLELE